MKWNVACSLFAIAGDIVQVPCHVVKSLPLIWRLGTPTHTGARSSNELQWLDLEDRVLQDSSPKNDQQSNIPD